MIESRNIFLSTGSRSDIGKEYNEYAKVVLMRRKKFLCNWKVIPILKWKNAFTRSREYKKRWSWESHTPWPRMAGPV